VPIAVRAHVVVQQQLIGLLCHCGCQTVASVFQHPQRRTHKSVRLRVLGHVAARDPSLPINATGDLDVKLVVVS
jgi:hypothetical protein